MTGKWLWLLVAVAILLLGFIGWGVLTLKKDTSNRQQTDRGLPEELTSEFDPTVNEARFVIEATYPQLQVLRLRAVFPPGFENELVESIVTCREDDIKIVYRSGSEAAGSDVLFREIEKNSKENLIFSARCADPLCAEVNRDCRLFVAGEKEGGSL